jgi:hypothetical protein
VAPAHGQRVEAAGAAVKGHGHREGAAPEVDREHVVAAVGATDVDGGGVGERTRSDDGAGRVVGDLEVGPDALQRQGAATLGRVVAERRGRGRGRRGHHQRKGEPEKARGRAHLPTVPDGLASRA